MRIVVNDIAASKGGAMSVLRDFYHCVCENDKENEWIFLLGDMYFDETDNVKIIVRSDIKKCKWKKLFFDFFTGKRFIEGLKPDIVFSMQNIITFGLKVPQYVYLHQSIPFQSVKRFSFFKPKERKLAFIQHVLGFIIKKSVKKSDGVFVQTKWMKEAVSKMCKIPEERIIRVLPDIKDVSEYRCEDAFDRTSFFYPTATAIYKNNELVYKACDTLGEESLDFRVFMTVNSEKTVKNVDFIGRIPQDEVMKRYNESTLIFPSYIETFGYPLAEARAMGTVILASDCPFSREALDGYENAYFFDPFDKDELARLMKRVICGEIVRKSTQHNPHSSENSWIKIMNSVLS